MRKIVEPDSPELGEIGDKVEVKVEAPLLLLWEAGALLEELSASPERQRNR